MPHPALFVLPGQGSLVALLSLAIPVILFFSIGIYVVSGRWAASQPQRDARAIQRWEHVRQNGFWRFALRGRLLFFFGYFLISALFRSWRITGALTLSREELLQTLLLTFAVAPLAAWANWGLVRRRAEEAHDRAARAQDERFT